MLGLRSAAIGKVNVLLAMSVALAAFLLLDVPGWAALLIFLALRILVVAWSVKLVVDQHALAFAEVVSGLYQQTSSLNELLSEEGL